MAEIIERGKIRNREYAKQLRDFSGLRFGNITPTDIDGFLDFGNKVFIIFELKYGNSQLVYGQNLALERLCDASQQAEKQTYLIIAKHETNEDIDAASCRIIKYRHKSKWIYPKKSTTLKEGIKKIIKVNKLEY